mgnify:CR=1 FL=1
MLLGVFFFQAEDGIRDLVRSRGLGDVYKRQEAARLRSMTSAASSSVAAARFSLRVQQIIPSSSPCLLYTSDAADERSSVDLGGRRIIKKKNDRQSDTGATTHLTETHYSMFPEKSNNLPRKY